jgi:hypothetical protein
MAEQATRYQSPPETIALAQTTMRDIKEALTRNADGEFPGEYARIDWDGINMRPPHTAWQDMDRQQRFELLRDALSESIWSLEPSPKGNQPIDSEKLAGEFVRNEERQLHGEMRHDSVLRFLEDREVSYEDVAERPLDSADEGERHEGERAVSPADLTEQAEPAGQQQRRQRQTIGM